MSATPPSQTKSSSPRLSRKSSNMSDRSNPSSRHSSHHGQGDALASTSREEKDCSQKECCAGAQAPPPAQPPVQPAPPAIDPATCDFVTATQHGFTERCLQLLESEEVRADITDEENICPLHWAAINNRVDLIKIFITYGAKVDQIGGELGGTPLHWAVRQTCFPARKILLDAGARPEIMDTEGYTTLRGGWVRRRFRLHESHIGFTCAPRI